MAGASHESKKAENKVNQEKAPGKISKKRKILLARGFCISAARPNFK